MCLLLQSGPLPSPHISFPLASCLGPGQRSVGGGLCPGALLVLAPSIPTGDIEAGPDPEPLRSSWVWEPRNSCSFLGEISLLGQRVQEEVDLTVTAPGSGNAFESLFECGRGGGGNGIGCSLCSTFSGSLWLPRCWIQVVYAAAWWLGLPGLPQGSEGTHDWALRPYAG